MPNNPKLQLLLKYAAIVRKDRSFSKSRVFFLRSLLYYPIATHWLEFIDSFYKKYGFEVAPWNIAGLPIRSYVSFSFGIKKRLTLLENHYSLMAQIFDFETVRKLLLNQPILFSTLVRKDGQKCYFKLAILEKYWREGGLTIHLTDEEDLITTLTFSFEKNSSGQSNLIIGGLQGTILGKAKIVNITRGLHGLRPKYALLDCCYSFASCFGIDNIVAVSNKNHVFSKQDGRINSSYDEFWEEVGAIKNKDGNYQMPRACIQIP
ncbi:MAG: DUF535 domain-containing protein [Proteobacteria bacterium]|nr:DUF535 domain-containing protein [Pseudomonadota bacterium]